MLTAYQLSLNTLTTLLLSHLPHNTATTSLSIKPIAAIIDTTGTFPISLLARILKSRLLSTKPAPKDLDTTIQILLSYVSISRIFNIAGLWEVISEVSAPSTSPHPAPPEEEEIPSSDASDFSLLQRATSPGQASASDGETEVQIIIIDTLTPLLSSLFATSEKSSAHNLLTILSRSLYTLSTTRNIITILHNGVVPSRPAYTTPRPDTTSESGYGYAYQQRQEKPKAPEKEREKSVFEGNKIKPALGSLFSQFPSIHLFFSTLPKSISDAEKFYGRDRDVDPFSDSHPTTVSDLNPNWQGVECVTILEILKDESWSSESRKFGEREQRWTALEVNKEGIGLVSAFQEKGNMRGMGMSWDGKGMGDLGGLTERGRGVKMTLGGFGGRRV